MEQFIITFVGELFGSIADLVDHCDKLEDTVRLMNTKLSYYRPERISSYIIKEALDRKPWDFEPANEFFKNQYESLANKQWNTEFINSSIKDTYYWISLKSLHITKLIQSIYDYSHANGLPTDDFPDIMNKLSSLKEQYTQSAIEEFKILKQEMLEATEREVITACDKVNESIERTQIIIDMQKMGNTGIKPGGVALIENAMNEIKHANRIAEQAKDKLNEISQISGVALNKLWER